MKDEVTCLRSHSQYVAERGFEPHRPSSVSWMGKAMVSLQCERVGESKQELPGEKEWDTSALGIRPIPLGTDCPCLVDVPRQGSWGQMSAGMWSHSRHLQRIEPLSL